MNEENPNTTEEIAELQIPQEVVTTQVCTKCEKEKPLSDFDNGRFKRGTRNKEKI